MSGGASYLIVIGAVLWAAILVLVGLILSMIYGDLEARLRRASHPAAAPEPAWTFEPDPELEAPPAPTATAPGPGEAYDDSLIGDEESLWPEVEQGPGQDWLAP